MAVALQDWLNALQGVPGFTGDMNAPLEFYQGKTPNQLLQELLDPATGTLPDPKAGSLFDDMGAWSVLALPGLVGGVSGLMAGQGMAGFNPLNGLGDFGGAVSTPAWDYGPMASAGVSDVPQGIAGSVSGGEVGTGAFDMGASQGVFDSFGNPLYTSPSGAMMPPAIGPQTQAGYTGSAFASSAPGVTGTEYTLTDPSAVVNAGTAGAGFASPEALEAAAAKSGMSLMDFLKTPAGMSMAGNLLAGGLGALGSYAASQTQAKSAQDALNLQRYMYDTSRADLAPWREAGTGALNRIQQLTTPGDTSFQADPGYQWRLSQGEQAINRSMTPRQSFDSGATLKALLNYGQNQASAEYDKVLDRQFRLAGLGQSSTSQGVSLNQNFGNNAANTMMNAGNARASGYMGIANSLGQGLGNMANIYGQYRLMEGL